MVFFSDWFQHSRDCKKKHQERALRLINLPDQYQYPIGSSDLSILTQPIQDLVSGVHNGTTSPLAILYAYGKAAKEAHKKTNCLTELMLPEAERWAENEVNLKGPLAGIPVSLKDSIQVAGFDVTVGFSKNVGKPALQDGTMVQLLKEAGAVPFVKTALPITLLSFESTNDVWGRCTNPHNPKYSPGGSTGGEGALLALGGSRIGIGSDVAGSVRAPAHFSGCYSLRCSTGRWPKMGMSTSMPGQEGIASVFSPMARTLDDLRYFTRSFIGEKPWRLDYSVHPVEWRSDVEKEYEEKKVLKIGVLRTDGVVDPSPACARALQETVAALEAEGHELFDIDPPSPYEALKIASNLLNSDGCATFFSHFRYGEWNDSGAAQMKFYMDLPRPIKYLWYLWTKYVRKDDIWAGLIKDWHAKTAFEQWQLVAQREAYKAKWHLWWRTEAKMDFLITPTNATPALPHDAMHDAVASCGYTFLFNLLDYSAGVVPVTHVDRLKDRLPPTFDRTTLNGVARGAYKHYDEIAMDGLPVTIQVVGQRLQEELVSACMQRVEDALERHNGGKYKLLEIPDMRNFPINPEAYEPFSPDSEIYASGIPSEVKPAASSITSKAERDAPSGTSYADLDASTFPNGAW